MQFRVRALGSDSAISEMTIDATNEADARSQLLTRGFVISTIARSRDSWLTIPGRQRRGGLSLLLFSQELLALLNAGLGVVEALEALLEKEAAPATRAVLDRLLASLRDGKRFSATLAEQPDMFPPLYIGIVRAAEGTSDLPRALTRFIGYQQRIDTVRSKIISAAIYPTILLSVGGAVAIFLMTYVVPRFAEVYQGAGRDLPWTSQLMLSWGQIAAQYTALLLGCMGTTIVFAFVVLRRMVQQGGVVRLLARLPGIGERVRIYELSRLYLTLGMLAEGGIPVVQAISAVLDTVSPAVQSGLAKARATIEAGIPLSEAFEANGLTTPISLRLLRVGERTGDMGPMLTTSATFYDDEISRWIDRFTRTFEPLLMAAIGLIVGAIVLLLYMPIFDLAGDMT